MPLKRIQMTECNARSTAIPGTAGHGNQQVSENKAGATDIQASVIDAEGAAEPLSVDFAGIGSHLPRQRGRPRGAVERFGTRPENWRGLYYVYVIENGIEKRVQRRPVLGPTAVPGAGQTRWNY
jgi:hypothetical protein